MNQFFDFTSWEWWIGVVIVGIGINIVSNLIQYYGNKSWSSLSSNYKQRNEKMRKEIDAEIWTKSQLSHGWNEAYISYIMYYIAFTISLCSTLIILCLVALMSNINAFVIFILIFLVFLTIDLFNNAIKHATIAGEVGRKASYKELNLFFNKLLTDEVIKESDEHKKSIEEAIKFLESWKESGFKPGGNKFVLWMYSFYRGKNQ